jgi:hypothetical protein
LRQQKDFGKWQKIVLKIIKDFGNSKESLENNKKSLRISKTFLLIK